jgi:flagellar basal body rod protein FlgF
MTTAQKIQKTINDYTGGNLEVVTSGGQVSICSYDGQAGIVRQAAELMKQTGHFTVQDITTYDDDCPMTVAILKLTAAA